MLSKNWEKKTPDQIDQINHDLVMSNALRTFKIISYRDSS